MTRVVTVRPTKSGLTMRLSDASTMRLGGPVHYLLAPDLGFFVADNEGNLLGEVAAGGYAEVALASNTVLAEDGSGDEVASPAGSWLTIGLSTPDTGLVADFFDLPPLAAAHATAHGIYLAAASEPDKSFVGGDLYSAPVAAGAFTDVADINVEVEHGTALTALGTLNAVAGIWDYVNTVDVQLAYGEVQPRTKEEVRAGANLAVLGGEIFRFLNAEDLGDGKYRLSGILRGGFDTEPHMSEHVVGESFALLDNIAFVERDVGVIGSTRYYKPAAKFQSIDDVTVIARDHPGETLRPHRPARLRGRRDSAGNLTITWERTTRVPFDLLTESAPFVESSERYRVVLYNTDGSVLRDEIVTDQEFEYLAADQAADGVALFTFLKVEVNQVGNTVADGNVATRMV